ncbi:MAG: hypothetical protein ACFFF4_16155 [Candidatus Thorarchaeota archaeon]
MNDLERAKIQKRDTYSIKTLLTDLKKMRLTPNLLYTVGSEIIYYEWQRACENLGENDEVVVQMKEFLDFLQHDYERRLIRGEIRREEDTPNVVINTFLKETPIEFQSYTLERSGEFILGVLRAAQAVNQKDLVRYKVIEEKLRNRLKEDKANSELWNELRLVLWILGRYDEASEAFKKAKKLGWEPSKSKTIGV